MYRACVHYTCMHTSAYLDSTQHYSVVGIISTALEDIIGVVSTCVGSTIGHLKQAVNQAALSASDVHCPFTLQGHCPEAI